MNKNKVYVVGLDGLVSRMFLSSGWLTVDAIDEADLIVFTGGSDVSPELYGEVNVGLSYTNPRRDRDEQYVYEACIELGKPMAGICRGGQFLNVMCGGAMYQDVERHAIGGTHKIVDSQTNRQINVTSTHHQMMIMHKEAELVALAALGGEKSALPKDMLDREALYQVDQEVVYYDKQKCLCFQPHPEYGENECKEYFFEVLNRKLGFN